MSRRPITICRRRPRPTSAAARPYALNDKLRDVELIGLGQIEAPEDVILDRDDNLYGGSRHGDIVRFLAPDYTRMEVFAHIGGQPLGMAFDRDDNLLLSASAAWGSIAITPDGKVEKATDETNRSLLLDQRRHPAAARRRSRHRRRRPHLLLARRPSATRCTNGRSTGSKRAATAASSATTRTPARRAPCCAT